MASISVLLLGSLLTIGGCADDTPSNKRESVPVERNAPPSSAPKRQPLTLRIDTLDRNDLPPDISFKGKPAFVYRWTDANGENILIGTVTEATPEPRREYEGDQEYYTELHAYQYVRRGDRYELLWQLADRERHCPFDLIVKFLPNSTTITDLDGDDTTETTVVYYTACKSDVSPIPMKVIMREAGRKFALRGVTQDFEDTRPLTEQNVCCIDSLKKNYDPDSWEYYSESAGKYENEKEFEGAPPQFLTFARRQWITFAAWRSE